MLCSDDELVRVAGMLVVMDQTGDEGGEVVMLLQALLDTTLLQEEVQALQTIQYMNHVVVVILLEVSELHFCGEIAHGLELNVVQFEEVVVFEYLEGQELQTVLRHSCLEVERVELDGLQVLDHRLVHLASEVFLADHCEELLLDGVNQRVLDLTVRLGNELARHHARASINELSSLG